MLIILSFLFIACDTNKIFGIESSFDAPLELFIYYMTILSIDLKNAISFDALFFELFVY